MKCQFCHQDVDNPCHNAEEMQQRAASHVDRCEHALKDHQGVRAGAHRSDIQSGG
ncbi:hypothetical protein JKG68_07870 [Microvirga aerilata]|uniref:Uncharacterized protein n=1 Tax=Microvirga aerilata TaxID=670292 RepID=A0A937CYV4_9HYPH|nr:hypothetical protein [Microvirga aerilata]MBL0403876.1 hypothetical protein [Microvirga aerilata]